jgi:hypothetical protein
MADGVARVLVTRPRDDDRVKRLSSGITEHLSSPRATRATLRGLLRREAAAAEAGLSHRSWEPEVARFATIDALAGFLRRRAGKPGLPAIRPLREGDVFWIFVPEVPLEPDLLRAYLPLDRYVEIGADVWDVTAAARQAAKRAYNAAVEGEASAGRG